jgi:hypothetical protein
VWFEFQIQTYFLLSNQFILTLALEIQIFAYKCAQLNSLFSISCWDRILANLLDFSNKA